MPACRVKKQVRIASTFCMAIIMIITFAIGGCSPLKQPAPRVQSYFLEYPPPAFCKPMIPATLSIAPFTISPEYNTDQILYRDSPFGRNTYAYHRWQANPARMVQYYLARDLLDSRAFKGVFPPNVPQEGLYSLDGAVNEFLEVDGAERWEASLSLTLTLQKIAEADVSKRVIFQKTFTACKSLASRHPRSLAQAMSEAMAEISAEVIEEVYGALGGGKGN